MCNIIMSQLVFLNVKYDTYILTSLVISHTSRQSLLIYMLYFCGGVSTVGFAR